MTLRCAWPVLCVALHCALPRAGLVNDFQRWSVSLRPSRREHYCQVETSAGVPVTLRGALPGVQGTFSYCPSSCLSHISCGYACGGAPQSTRLH